MTAWLCRSGLLADRPLRVLDLGARGGAESVWDVYGTSVELICFEPDRDSCDELNRKATKDRGRRETYYPYAVAGGCGERTLHVTANGVSSSLYETNWPLVERFSQGDGGQIVKAEPLSTVGLDWVAEKEGLPPLDFMKLDIEGCELEALAGGTRSLEGVLGLSIEVFFQPYHLQRPLFADVQTFMIERGYSLFDLKLEHWRRRGLTARERVDPYDGGQVMWAQALYLRDPIPEWRDEHRRGSAISGLAVLKYASLCEVNNLSDCALEVLEEAERCGYLPAEHARDAISHLLATRSFSSPLPARTYRLRLPFGVRVRLARAWRVVDRAKQWARSVAPDPLLRLWDRLLGRR